MDNAGFSQTFVFRQFTRMQYHHVDNSQGCIHNYIGFMWQGKAKLTSKDETIEVGPGDYFFIPYLCRYHSYWYGDPIARFDSFGFHFFPENQHLILPLQKIPATDAIRSLHAPLVENKEITCENIGRFYLFLGAILKQMRAEPVSPRHQMLDEVIRCMERQPTLRVPELARRCGLSESSLYAIFQDILGITPVEKKHQILAEKAVELLTTTDESVEAISEKLGFSSTSYFRKILLKETHKTPRDIRKNTGI